MIAAAGVGHRPQGLQAIQQRWRWSVRNGARRERERTALAIPVGLNASLAADQIAERQNVARAETSADANRGRAERSAVGITEVQVGIER